MGTGKDSLEMDFGLNTIFDGKMYQLVMSQSQQAYPIGGLLCEYMRLVPIDLKEIILSCDDINGPVTRDAFYKVMQQFHEKINQRFPAVISTMVAMSFLQHSKEWFIAVKARKTDEFIEEMGARKSIMECIFENTGIDNLGGDSILQLMLTILYVFTWEYALTKQTFLQLVESDEYDDDEHNNTIKTFMSMLEDRIDIQHIDYRLVLTNKGIESLYTIKSSFSLLIFEMAHLLNSEISLVRCKNCGHYFVPVGRSDAVYCSYPLRDNPNKTCKDVGAQVTRARKEHDDVATKEYRKLYMRYKMAVKRHPEDKEVAAKFDRLTTEVRQWRNQLYHGKATTDDFLRWLKEFENE